MKNIFKINIDENRIFGLDILRACAILFVVVGHGNFILPSKIGYYINFLVFDGVSIFFVLSGFLIGGILIKELEKKEISLGFLTNFWRRRWYRTLPNYFLILIILSLLQLIFSEKFSFSDISKYFIFSQNLFTPPPSWFFPEAWSLSIEEWFYLIVPVIIIALLFLFSLTKKKVVLYTSFIVILAVTSFRINMYFHTSVHSISEFDAVFRKQVLSRLDSLMFGVIGSYILFYYKSGWLKYKNQLFITGIIFLLVIRLLGAQEFNLYYCVFSFSINAIGTLFILPYLSTIRKGNGMAFYVITYISLISYSMYLINLSLVQKWILGSINFSAMGADFGLITKYILFWTLTILISILIYKYYEVPMTKLRDKK